MDTFWYTLQHGSENMMSQEFDPFADNAIAPSHDVEVEEVPATQFISRPPAARKESAKKVSSGKKLANFTVEEDLILVSCWLNMSTDLVVGTGQRADPYWKRIYDAYNANRGQHPERTQKSVNKRWDTIKKNVSLFSGFYQQVLNRNQSGTVVADKTSEAITMFARIMERPFTMTHCWDVLKNEVKWIDLQNKQKKQDDQFGDHDGGHVPDHDARGSNNIHIDNACSSPVSSMGKRPMGRKAAKEARKRSTSSSNSQQSSAQFVSTMQELQLERFNFMKDGRAAREERMHSILSIEERKVAAKEMMMKMEAERITMERERLDMMKKKEKKMEEERILAVDLDKCNPAQKMYYKALQDGILARIGS